MASFDASTSVAVICFPAVTSTSPFAAFTCVSVISFASFSVMFPAPVVSATCSAQKPGQCSVFPRNRQSAPSAATIPWGIELSK